MLYFKPFRSKLNLEQATNIPNFKMRVAEKWSPVLRPALEATAAGLGLNSDALRQNSIFTTATQNRATTVIDGEIFTDGNNLVIVTVDFDPMGRTSHGRRDVVRPESIESYNL